MALAPLIGSGFWLPSLPSGLSDSQQLGTIDTTLLDADEEEHQIIGRVRIDGGGSKTFGTSGSKISWLPGPTIAFVAVATLRVGVKKAASVDAAAGPPARATIGAAAFDVYDDLIGGTDTITSTTWRDEAMTAGTPFTVTDGDLIAICFHLDLTSGTQSVKFRSTQPNGSSGSTVLTLVTSGPTYTAQAAMPNCILTFDDGTLGWLEGTLPFSAAETASATIGNTNIFGNIFRVPFLCKVDAIAAYVVTTGAADFALDLYETPLGTPSLIEAVAFDGNITSSSSGKLYVAPLLTPRTLTLNTDYLVGVRQTSATAVVTRQRDQSNAAYNKPLGMGAECYGATSTAGATFAAINSGKRRYHMWVRVSHLDDGRFWLLG